MLQTEERGAQAMLATASIAIVATATHRTHTWASQDAASVIVRPDYCATIVADGMGAHADSGKAAYHCATEARAILEEADYFPDPLVLFEQVQQSLAKKAPEWLDEMPPETRARIDLDRAFGTTLIVGAETENALLVAYVGNGCAFHLRGDFASFPEQIPLPWSCVNLLNPHTVCENGREALYRYQSPTSSLAMATPSLVVVGTDHTFGNILLIATDGLYSYDQVRRGVDPDGELWISTGKPLLAVHAALRSLFLQPGELTAGSVQEAMDACLEKLRSDGLLEDDTTLGLMISPQALAYRNSLQEANPPSEEGG